MFNRLSAAAVVWGLAMGASTGAFAQDSSNRVSTETDWSIFVAEDPAQCWIVSAPKQVRNVRDGQEVAARRGDIRLYVSYWADGGGKGEVSLTGGYPYREGSPVTVTVGSDSFQFVSSGEDAWAAPGDDARVIAAMRRGAQAVVVGVSGRGTRTEDTFSLLGFTAAVEDAETRCAG